MKISLGKLAVWITENKLKTFIATLIVTVIMIIGASTVKMEMSFFSILPDHTEKFRDLKTIMDEFPFASNMIVVLDAKNIKDKDKTKEVLIKTVDEITDELYKNNEYVTSVLGRVNTDIIKNHGLMLTKSEDIKRFNDLYKQGGLLPLITNLNNDLEKEYSGNEENLKDDEAMASNQFRNIERILELIHKSLSGNLPADTEVDNVISDYLYGENYFFNKDYTQATMYVLPNFVIEDLAKLVPGVNSVESTVLEIAEKNGITAGLTGLCTVSRDEMVTSSNGFLLSLTIAAILILSLLIVVLKMRSVPIIIGIPLFTGIIWTIGITGFVFNRLNLVTAMYMIALIGLGVDYAIHIMTNFVIEKEEGADYKKALEITYNETGKGIITGALTTAAAFLALLVSDTKMLQELGFIAGLGIICELLATLIIIPMLISIRESRLKPEVQRNIKVKAAIASGFGSLVVKNHRIIIVITVVAAGILSFKVNDVQIQGNLMEMEAKGLKSIALQDEMVEEFEMAPDVLMVLTNSLAETKELEKRLKKLSSVKSVDSIASYLPTPDEYSNRIPLIENFKENLRKRIIEKPEKELLVDQIIRLEANLLELSELSYISGMQKMTNTLNSVTGFNNDNEKIKDSIFDNLVSILSEENYNMESFHQLQMIFDTKLTERLLTMSNTEKVTLSMIPDNIKTSFISKGRDKYLISISPTRNPWHKDFRQRHKNQIESVTQKATGMILASDELATMTRVDGVKTSLLALSIVLILLIIDFRNIKLALMTVIPLILSFISLFSVMALTGIEFDFINIIAIPLLIGIGIDDAVHINHRYLHEGSGSMKKVIKHAGSAVLLTSLTTTIGFASFIPSPMTGLSLSGIVFSCAIMFAFTFSILFYPSLLIMVSEEWKLNINPWGRRKK